MPLSHISNSPPVCCPLMVLNLDQLWELCR